MAPDVAAILAQEQATDPALDRFLSLCDHYLPSRTAVFAQKPVDKPKV
jgi:hypothetical protein